MKLLAYQTKDNNNKKSKSKNKKQNTKQGKQ